MMHSANLKKKVPCARAVAQCAIEFNEFFVCVVAKILEQDRNKTGQYAYCLTQMMAVLQIICCS